MVHRIYEYLGNEVFKISAHNDMGYTLQFINHYNPVYLPMMFNYKIIFWLEILPERCHCGYSLLPDNRMDQSARLRRERGQRPSQAKLQPGDPVHGTGLRWIPRRCGELNNTIGQGYFFFNMWFNDCVLGKWGQITNLIIIAPYSVMENTCTFACIVFVNLLM